VREGRREWRTGRSNFSRQVLGVVCTLVVWGLRGTDGDDTSLGDRRKDEAATMTADQLHSRVGRDLLARFSGRLETLQALAVLMGLEIEERETEDARDVCVALGVGEEVRECEEKEVGKSGPKEAAVDPCVKTRSRVVDVAAERAKEADAFLTRPVEDGDRKNALMPAEDTRTLAKLPAAVLTAHVLQAGW
jgi:hypothetical protein